MINEFEGLEECLSGLGKLEEDVGNYVETETTFFKFKEPTGFLPKDKQYDIISNYKEVTANAITKTKLNLPPLTKRQRDIFDSFLDNSLDIITVCCGRQVGKTQTIVITSIYVALKPIHGQKKCNIGIFLPTYKQCKILFNRMKDILQNSTDDKTLARFNKSEMCVYFKNGSFVQFYTTQNENCRGGTFDYVFVDEASDVSTHIWQSAIQATASLAVSNKCGKYLIASTPKDKSWFYELCISKADGHKNIKFTSEEGGRHGKGYFEKLKKTIPPAIYANEYLAEFVEGLNSFFDTSRFNFVQPINKVVYNDYKNDTMLCEPIIANVDDKVGHIAAIDWGFQHDYTVLSIFNKRRELIFLKRYRLKPYEDILADLVLNLNKYGKPRVYSEVNGVGRQPTTTLRNMYISTKVIDFNTAQQNKIDILTNLTECLISSDVSKKVSIINDDSILKQFTNFGFTFIDGVLKFKSLKYGIHDDDVMSIAIAAYYVTKKPASTSFFTQST